MAKKFGKFLLFTAAVGTACAAAYYYMQKKDAVDLAEDADEDYDDFSEDAEATRTYVSLNRDAQAEASSEEDSADKEFTPLSETVSEGAAADSAEAVEEFFDEDDGSELDPPLEED